MAKAGRPAFACTAARKRQVAELVSCGMTVQDVARVLGCSPDTLRKHFPEELRSGTAKKRAEVIGLLFRSARKGNVAAQKHLSACVGAAGGPDKPSALSVKGKKAAAQDDAARVAAGGDNEWGSDLAFDGGMKH